MYVDNRSIDLLPCAVLWEKKKKKLHKSVVIYKDFHNAQIKTLYFFKLVILCILF